MTERKVDLEVELERIFVKSSSIELTDTKRLFDLKWQPNCKVSFNVDVSSLGSQKSEIELTLSLTVDLAGIEEIRINVTQAAHVRIKNDIDVDVVKRGLATLAVDLLFPYARETVDNLAVKSSLPPFHLPPLIHPKDGREFTVAQGSLQPPSISDLTRSRRKDDDILN